MKNKPYDMENFELHNCTNFVHMGKIVPEMQKTLFIQPLQEYLKSNSTNKLHTIDKINMQNVPSKLLWSKTKICQKDRYRQ